MFYVNLPGKGELAHDVVDAENAVYLPQACMLHEVLPSRSFRRLLWDPQLYLATLDGAACTPVCAHLASYPWFDVPGVRPFDSDAGDRVRAYDREMKERVATHWPAAVPADIERAAASCLAHQTRIQCTEIILPAPLITDREEEAHAAAEWLDAGLRAAQDLLFSQPMLATVAVHESALNEAAFSTNGFLDLIVDPVTAREGIGGVYIVVAQMGARHPFLASRSVLRAYAHLCRAFSTAGAETIVVNFADVFGVSCLAAGASSCATGPSQVLRRLSFEGLREQGGGTPLPHYYSHRCVAEFRSEQDMRALTEHRLLRRVRDDTRHSSPLTQALASGGHEASVPGPWVESRNNVFSGAQLHFICRLHNAAQALAPLAPAERSQAVVDWLEEASASQLLIQERMRGAGGEIVGKVAPVEEWLTVHDQD
jgi:hypothetical protein